MTSLPGKTLSCQESWPRPGGGPGGGGMRPPTLVEPDDCNQSISMICITVTVSLACW